MNVRHQLPLLAGAASLALALGLAEWRQSNPPWAAYQPGKQIRTLIPTISNKPELCLTCHFGIEEISKSHPIDVFGCVSCHGGDPLSLDQTAAHRVLLGPNGNPSDLGAVRQTCGTAQCHGGDLPSNRNHIARVELSLHATYAGAINTLLQLSGIPGFYGIDEAHADTYGAPNAVDTLIAFDPATFAGPDITAFAKNCLTCHLGASAVAAPYFYRGTGCAACHTPYRFDGRYEGGDPTIRKDEAGHPARHALTVLMPYTQCSQCHARGTYSTESLTFTPRDAAGLTGKRESDYQPHRDPAAVKCELELDCIDCHNAYEAMGDGRLYPALDSSPVVECRTCHGTASDPPPLLTLEDPNHPAFRRDALNDNYALKLGDSVVQSPNGDVLGAVRWQEERLVLTSRITGQTFRVPPVQGSACQQKPDQQQARYCRECHAANR